MSYGTGTLDGLAYLKDTHPGDYGGVTYLRTLQGDERIVEAEGETTPIIRGYHLLPGSLQLSECHFMNTCGEVMIQAGLARDHRILNQSIRNLKKP